MPKTVLLACEMVGTYNALQKPLGVLTDQHGCDIRYAATAAALKAMQAKSISAFTPEDDPAEVIAEIDPNLVIIGVAAGAAFSGFELAYSQAAMDRGVPLVVYRDFSGINTWAGGLVEHPKSRDLLHFWMFDRATANELAHRGWADKVKEVAVVGSAYYDDILTRAWHTERVAAREAAGILPNELVIVLASGASRDRVLEGLMPTVEGLLLLGLRGGQEVVFIPTFHPKDPDAPYLEDPDRKGHYLPKVSYAYDGVIDRLNGSHVRVIREPAYRNAIPDGKLRMAAANLVVMNPLSTETWTCWGTGTPQVILGLPLTRQDAEKGGVDISGADFVAAGAPVVWTEVELTEFVAHLGDRYHHFLRLANGTKDSFPKEPATATIVSNIARLLGD